MTVPSIAQYLVQKSTSGDADSTAPPDGQPDLLKNLQLLSVLFPFPPHSVAFTLDPKEFLLFIPSTREVFNTTNRYWLHFSMGFMCSFFDSMPLLKCGSVGSIPFKNAPICRHQFMKQFFDTFTSLWDQGTSGMFWLAPFGRLIHHISVGGTHRPQQTNVI
jgi:hypothetical protein